MDRDQPGRSHANRAAVGIWFVVAGLLLTLDEFGVLHIGGLGHLWPTGCS